MADVISNVRSQKYDCKSGPAGRQAFYHFNHGIFLLLISIFLKKAQKNKALL